MTHKIITVAFPIIEPLTVLMVTRKRFIFLHSNAVSNSMKYLKNTLKKLKHFMKYFKRKNMFLHISRWVR